MPYLKSTLMRPLNDGTKSPEEKIDKLYADYRGLTAASSQTPTYQYLNWTVMDKEPSKNDAEDFLDAFARVCAAESKEPEAAALKVERVKAIRLIQSQFVQVNSVTCTQFRHVNRNRFAIELALRVRRPQIIDQGSEVFCGPASLYHGFLKTQPREAALFATNLVDLGKANLRNYTVEPLDSVKNLPMPVHITRLAPVDWILLASLRHHFEPLAELAGLILGQAGAAPLRELTKPGLLVNWLEKMGYQQVRDRTFLESADVNFATWMLDKLSRSSLQTRWFFQSIPQGETNVNQAIQDLTNHCLIFLWAYGDLSSYAPTYDKAAHFQAPTGTPQTELFLDLFPGLHWTLVRKLDMTATHVNMKFHTWGGSREVSYLKADFFRVYRGHISAQVI
jgi:hypothetical protein